MNMNEDAWIKQLLYAEGLYEFEKRFFAHPRSSIALKIQAQRWGITLG